MFTALLALSLAAPVPKAKEVPPPFPLTVGDTLEYELKTGDKASPAYSDEVTKAERQKDGSTRVTVRRSYPRGEPSTLVVAVADTGLTRVAEGDTRLAEPVMLLKLPATVGTAGEAGGTEYEVTATEEVTVAAGTYRAVKVVEKSGKYPAVRWYAPGVGLVKMAVKGGESSYELKAFKSGK